MDKHKSSTTESDTTSLHAEQLLDIGLSHLQAGDIPQAFAAVVKAKALKVPVANLDYLRALVFLKQQHAGFIGNAKQSLLEELRHFPENKEAQELLDDLMQAPDSCQDEAQLAGTPGEFQEWYGRIREHSMLPMPRLLNLYLLSKQVCEADLPGDFMECGVAGGGSTALLGLVIQKYSSTSSVDWYQSQSICRNAIA